MRRAQDEITGSRTRSLPKDTIIGATSIPGCWINAEASVDIHMTMAEAWRMNYKQNDADGWLTLQFRCMEDDGVQFKGIFEPIATKGVEITKLRKDSTAIDVLLGCNRLEYDVNHPYDEGRSIGAMHPRTWPLAMADRSYREIHKPEPEEAETGHKPGFCMDINILSGVGITTKKIKAMAQKANKGSNRYQVMDLKRMGEDLIKDLKFEEGTPDKDIRIKKGLVKDSHRGYREGMQRVWMIIVRLCRRRLTLELFGLAALLARLVLYRTWCKVHAKMTHACVSEHFRSMEALDTAHWGPAFSTPAQLEQKGLPGTLTQRAEEERMEECPCDAAKAE